MKCSNCGNEISAGMKFCKYCGAKINSTDTSDLQSKAFTSNIQNNTFPANNENTQSGVFPAGTSTQGTFNSPYNEMSINTEKPQNNTFLAKRDNMQSGVLPAGTSTQGTLKSPYNETSINTEKPQNNTFTAKDDNMQSGVFSAGTSTQGTFSSNTYTNPKEKIYKPVDVETPVHQNKHTRNKPQRATGQKSKAPLIIVSIIAVLCICAGSVFALNHLGIIDIFPKKETAEKSKTTEPKTDVKKEKPENTDLNIQKEDPTEKPKTPASDMPVAVSLSLVDSTVEKITKYTDALSSGVIDGTLNKITLPGAGSAYYSGDELKIISVNKNNTGGKYDRSFYYKEGNLVYAYYVGDNSAKLYFDDGDPVRFREYPSGKGESEAINHDDMNNESDTKLVQWINLAYADSYALYKLASSVMEENAKAAPQPLVTPQNSYNVINSSEFMLYGSDSRYIDKSELRGFTKEQCRIALNELYARYGRKFKDESLMNYFMQFEWYTPLIDPENFNEKTMFNAYEAANRDLIIQYEKEQGYR